MPRAKKKPSIEEQLRTLIMCATESQRYTLAKRLIDILNEDEKQSELKPEAA